MGEESGEEQQGVLLGKPGVDPLTQRIGPIGKWQCLVGLVYGMTIGLFAWQSFANKFFSYPVKFSCGESHGSFNYSCSNIATRCNGSLIFDETQFSNTIVSRWDLICDQSHYPRLAQTFTFLGNLVGALGSGQIADARGRRTLVTLSLFLLGVFGSLGPLAPNFYIWTALRFFTGLTVTSVNIGANVYFIEILDGKWRSICSALFGGVPLQLGILSLGLLVYLVPNMISVEYIIGGSAFPICLMWYFLPESPRWCLSMGQLEKAEAIVKKISKFNGIVIEGASLSNINSEKSSQSMMFELLKHPGVRRNFLIMSFNWFGFTLAYYGLVYNTPAFDFNIFLVFALPTFFAIPLNFIIPFIENNLGRKPLLTGSMSLAGLFLIFSFILSHYNWIVTMLSILGTVVCFAAMSSGYIYCKELFPTVLRTTALSFATVSARLGTIMSPLIGSLDSIYPALPIAIYGCVSLAGGISSIWLWPETKNNKLPDTLSECEAEASSKNPWTQKCSCSNR